MKITFEHYALKRGIVLRPWQKVAAKALLSAIYPHRLGASGKTFLVSLLRDFINEHGTDFALRVSPGTPKPIPRQKPFMR